MLFRPARGRVWVVYFGPEPSVIQIQCAVPKDTTLLLAAVAVISDRYTVEEDPGKSRVCYHTAHIADSAAPYTCQ